MRFESHKKSFVIILIKKLLHKTYSNAQVAYFYMLSVIFGAWLVLVY